MDILLAVIKPIGRGTEKEEEGREGKGKERVREGGSKGEKERENIKLGGRD